VAVRRGEVALLAERHPKVVRAREPAGVLGAEQLGAGREHPLPEHACPGEIAMRAERETLRRAL
jgi:hypothetical protein